MRLTGLSGRVALVTGAGGGIGRSVAHALAVAGVHVAVTDVYGPKARRVAAYIRREGHEASAWALDVTKPAQMKHTVRAIERQCGAIDICVNVAGVFVAKPSLAMRLDEWDTIFAVNARGVFICSTIVARQMIKRGRGVIITVASQSAKIIRLGQGAYGASKAATTYYTKCLGLELADRGIRCNVVNPGVTNTMISKATRLSSREIAKHVEGDPSRFRAGIPIGRIAEPEDVANAVLFLASDEARHITMADVLVDGGSGLLY